MRTDSDSLDVAQCRDYPAVLARLARLIRVAAPHLAAVLQGAGSAEILRIVEAVDFAADCTAEVLRHRVIAERLPTRAEAKRHPGAVLVRYYRLEE